jgi:hypothetical protein
MLQLKILFRNAFHNKLRSGLTILGITVAVLAFGLRNKRDVKKTIKKMEAKKNEGRRRRRKHLQICP